MGQSGKQSVSMGIILLHSCGTEGSATVCWLWVRPSWIRSTFSVVLAFVCEWEDTGLQPGKLANCFWSRFRLTSIAGCMFLNLTAWPTKPHELHPSHSTITVYPGSTPGRQPMVIGTGIVLSPIVRVLEWKHTSFVPRYSTYSYTGMTTPLARGFYNQGSKEIQEFVRWILPLIEAATVAPTPQNRNQSNPKKIFIKWIL